MSDFFVLRESVGPFEAGEQLIADNIVGDVVYVHSLHALLPSVPLNQKFLLKMSRFLQYKPKYDYWALRRYFKEDEYISRPYQDTGLAPEYGPIPFHFESLGEALFYLKRIKHKSADYLICRFQHLPQLVT